MSLSIDERATCAPRPGPRGSERAQDRGSGAWQGILLAPIVGAVCGIASAIFLRALDRATALREAHEGVVYALPLAGLLLGAAHDRWGRSTRGGSSLVIDTIHEGGAKIPLRMAPLVLLGTVVTHLFGGSAGREGTAVQMGASLADSIAHRFRVSPGTRRQLLAAGMAGGFGSVFGTPIAGTLFGLEVVCVGRIDYGALSPALLSSVIADQVARRLGAVHTPYPQLAPLGLSPAVFGKLVVIAAAMGLAAIVFIELTHRLRRLLESTLPSLALRMSLGGAAVVLLWKAMGTSEYLGLGVPTIVGAFSAPGASAHAFAAKLVFTSVTLASGFLGGEVTPLFFVGATLGSALARGLALPIDIGAGVGIAAVFGAASNTPLALSIMAVELLGAAALPHVVIVCVVAYLLTGHRSIYPAQRILRSKLGGEDLPRPLALRDLPPAPAPGAPIKPLDPP